MLNDSHVGLIDRRAIDSVYGKVAAERLPWS